MFNDYYELLGVEPDSSTDEIKQAFRRRARESHPDLHPEHSNIQTGEMRLLNEAHEILTDSRKRKAYDEEWRSYYKIKGTVPTDSVRKPTLPLWKDHRFLGFLLIVLLIVLLVGIVARFRERLKIFTPAPGQNIGSSQAPEDIRTERLGILLETIERNPEDLPAITEAAVILNRQGKHEEALHLAETGLEIAETRGGNMPHRVSRNLTAVKLRLLNVAYQSCIQLDDQESAGDYILELLELTPDNEQAQNALERLEQETD